MKNIARTIALTVSLMLPIPAAASVQVNAQDTVAGLGTIIEVKGMASGEAVIVPPFGSEIVEKIGTDGTVEVAGKDSEAIGTYEVEAYDGDKLMASGFFEVLPESMEPTASSIQSDYPAMDPNGEDTVQVTVILRDRYANPLSGRPVELISSRSEDSITSLSSETDSNGAQVFEVASRESGKITLRAMDLVSGKLIDDTLELSAGDTSAVGGYYPAPQYNQPYYQPPVYNYPSYGPAAPTTSFPENPRPSYQPPVSATPAGYNVIGSVMGRALYGQANGFDVISTFKIDVPENMKANDDATIKITAIDQNGKRVEDYTGTAFLSSTDPTALLPLEGKIQFQPQNLGEKVLTLGLRFRSPGEHILHLEDSSDKEVNTQVTVVVSGGEHSSAPTLKITSHKNNATINSETVKLKGEGPPFINLLVTGGKKDISGETDQDGEFSIKVKLNDEQTDHTLRVRDESGRFDSGNIHLILDVDPPEIETIIFDPVEPEVGGTTTVTVETAEGAKDVVMTLNDEELELLESETESGSFTVDFVAPEAGTYQPVVRAEDSAGNEVEMIANIIVKEPGLPQIENVAAKEKSPGAIELTWDAVEGNRVDAYRIYVGEKPDDFLYTLDTKKATAKATIAGLEASKSYYFSVTALQGDRESEEKSETIEYTTQGLGLKASGQSNTIMLEWNDPPEGTTLSAYLLEYGVAEGSYTEQRTISGELRKFALRDIINGVTYYIRITPVSTAGEVMRDMAGEVSGTPEGSASAFTPTPAQQAPPGTFAAQPTAPPTPSPSAQTASASTQYHGGAPSTPSTGLPLPVWIAIAISGFFLYLHWHRRKTMKMTLDFMKQMESQYRSE